MSEVYGSIKMHHYMRDLHVKEAEVNELLADLCPVDNISDDFRNTA